MASTEPSVSTIGDKTKRNSVSPDSENPIHIGQTVSLGTLDDVTVLLGNTVPLGTMDGVSHLGDIVTGGNVSAEILNMQLSVTVPVIPEDSELVFSFTSVLPKIPENSEWVLSGPHGNTGHSCTNSAFM